MSEYLSSSWGLSLSFAGQVALLYAYLWSYNLNPKITSGFRDPEKQKEMVKRWDAGNRAGLVRRPAVDSLHSRVTGNRSPAALAIDIDTSDRPMAGKIALALNIGWGGSFTGSGNYDPVHFFHKEGL